MKTITSLLALTTALLVLAMPARADNPGMKGANLAESNSLRVAYGDLNLASQAGVDTLYARLRSAAKRVCSPREDIRNLLRHREWRQCMRSALDGAVGDLNVPALSRTHQAATGYIPHGDLVRAE